MRKPKHDDGSGDGAPRTPQANDAAAAGPKLSKMYPPATTNEMLAVAAWLRGDASSMQQQLAATYVLNKVCVIGLPPFLPGDQEGGAIFNAGRQFVGQAILSTGGVPVVSLPVPKRRG